MDGIEASARPYSVVENSMVVRRTEVVGEDRLVRNIEARRVFSFFSFFLFFFFSFFLFGLF